MRGFVVLLLLACSPGLLAAQAAPVPRTSFEGPALEFDFPGLHIGVAEYDEGPTGATVFYFPQGVMAAVDVRGGAPGTIGTDFLRLSYPSSFVDAISFAGGSSYGLAAATGAADAIRSMREDAGSWGNIATVPGAIIFDLGPRRFNAIVPDETLGRAALRAARPGRFPLGPRGAGRFAMQGGYYDSRGIMDRRQHSGQGGAFRQIGPTKVAVFTIVNSLGVIVDRQGRVARCGGDPAAECGTAADLLARTLDQRTQGAPVAALDPSSAGPTTNTTLTLVVTNQKLDIWALQRLAVQVHTSMSRAIQPFHTQQDGDVLFAVSTGEVENSALSPVDLGTVASEVAWDAVLGSVPPLPSAEAAVAAPAPAILARNAGRYEFGPGAELTIVREGNRLFAQATGTRPVYGFALNERVELFPSSDTHFFSRNVRGDRLRFVRDRRNRVTGLEMNPGSWGLPARRLQ
ncbi:MAG: P1 family peptidase [Gemmatimonadetes bacterium]|nr:P1 family peptidase [Gemmatimonadota bacterium]